MERDSLMHVTDDSRLGNVGSIISGTRRLVIVWAGLVSLFWAISSKNGSIGECWGDDQSSRPASPALPSAEVVKPAGTEIEAEAGESLGALLVVVGASGTEEYGRQFSQWAERWRSVATAAGWKVVTVSPLTEDPAESPSGPSVPLETSPAAKSQLEMLRHSILEETEEQVLPMWIVLIGHGTDDGRTARFNLSGPDVSADDLAVWLAPLQRPLAVVNCSSSSGRFLQPLRAEGRVVIAATSGPGELNFSRFGGELSAIIGDPVADTDKDGQTSLLEAFRFASRQTEEYYTSRGQLPTEHAMLDDNGDAKGTRAAAIPDTGPVPLGDGALARSWHLVPNLQERRLTLGQRFERDRLESEIDQLRQRKPSLDVDQYYAELESLFVQLAQLSASFME